MNEPLYLLRKLMIYPKFYSRPPIFERIIIVHAKIPEEIFEARFPEWQALVKSEYPHYEPITEWRIKAEETEEGIPIFDTIQPELRITPRFARKTLSGQFEWSMRCTTGKLAMNMHSNPNQGAERRYKHLFQEFNRWLPLWINHFSVTSIPSISVHYVNKINHLTVPSFINEQGQIFLDKVLTVFSSIPGAHEAVIPPLDCNATVLLKGREKAFLHIKVNDQASAPDVAELRLDMVVGAELSPDETSSDQILNLINWGHDRIIERFEVVFTDQAKMSFIPETE